MVRLVAAAIGSVMRLSLFGLLLPWSRYAYFSGIVYATICVAALFSSVIRLLSIEQAAAGSIFPLGMLAHSTRGHTLMHSCVTRTLLPQSY